MHLNNTGLVIIGRNEAKHLTKNLPKLSGIFSAAVFVDSNSSDDSVAIAKSNSLHVVDLDMSLPFSAGRARNAGFDWLVGQQPELEYVQFIDGDCELLLSYLERAIDYLDTHQDVVVVAGRRRELHPEASKYNAMCEVEWNSPVGEVRSCGGDFLIRTTVMQEIGGFNPTFIAGEEPEMCVRIRQAGYKIHRIDRDMTLHDANMHSVGQWWKRSERSGHAYAQGFAMHGKPPEHMNRREVLRILVFGGFCLVALMLSLFVDPRFLLLLLVFPVQAVRVYRNFQIRDHSEFQHRWYAVSCGFAYIPQFFGVLKFYWRKLTGKQATIIEYK